MDISGKIVQILDLQTGKGRNGEWKKQDFILETEDQFPKKICITLWQDKIDQFALQAGQKVKAFIDIESREFNGKWYTNVKAWNIENLDGGSSAPAQNEPYPFDMNEPPSPEDELPF
ncbi:MAG: DUF3127 domain-containing protein [Candidatus Cyclobacteriaceae bacterium M3_2C_046]